jgi:hypothetical protein
LPLRKDIWRPAIVDRPMIDIVTTGSFAGTTLRWLPPMRAYSFLADPFGLWRDDRLHIFVERFDYRDRHGVIELIVYDATLNPILRRDVLAEPWHLSYPFVFEADGEIWMLPEAHRSGGLTLYRAAEFPGRWERAAAIELDGIAIDATPCFHDGLWWLFYTTAGNGLSRIAHLHAAHAERLTGPWRPHPANPVWRDPASARPGGTPLFVDGRILLPVQDCSRTYGGGLRMLTIDRLSPDLFAAEPGRPLPLPSGIRPYDQGMHTMASVGRLTLIDVKSTKLALHGLAIEARREMLRLWARRRAGGTGPTPSAPRPRTDPP